MENNYYQYFQWIIKVVTGTSLSDADVTNLNNQILACPITAGMVVYSSRDLFNYLNNTHIVFEDACGSSDNNSGRQVKPKAAKNAPSVIASSNKVTGSIKVYPNPTNGILNIELPFAEKGNWLISLKDVYGKTIQEINASEGSTDESLQIKGASGIYLLNIINLSTGKQDVRKIILN